MEFRVFPAGFTLTPIKLPQQDGSQVDAMQLTVVDVSGQPVHIAFAGADWEMFQRAVSDPEGEAARQAARAKILPINRDVTNAEAEALSLPNDVLVWLDVETTGLDPHANCLLEVAAVATGMDANLTVVGDTFSMTVELPGDLLLRSIDMTVLEMHARSGLWKDCKDTGRSLETVWRAFRTWFVRNELGTPDTRSLAGRSVHFDRSWLEAHMPVDDLKLLRLSHRHFDLTSIKAFAAVAGIRVDVPEEAHRALVDVWADIALARTLISEVA